MTMMMMMMMMMTRVAVIRIVTCVDVDATRRALLGTSCTPHVMRRAHTGVCKQLLPFVRALILQSSGKNCHPAPDSVPFELIYSQGYSSPEECFAFFTYTGSSGSTDGKGRKGTICDRRHATRSWYAGRRLSGSDVPFETCPAGSAHVCQMTGPAGKSAYQGKPHIGPIET